MRGWLAVALGGLSCAGSGAPGGATAPLPPTAVVVPPELKAPATAATARAKPDEANYRELMRLARLALKKTDFSSASRLEINKKFPSSEQVKEALVRAGAPWSDEDWFGEPNEVPPLWQIAIGVEVEVPAAQAVIAACVSEGKTAIRLERMSTDGALGHLRRIYVGGLDVKTLATTNQSVLIRMLMPGISRENFYGLFEEHDESAPDLP